MPDLRAIHKQITDRLKELESLLSPLQSEYEQLKSIATKLVGGGSSASAKSAPAAAAPARRRRASTTTAKTTAAKPRARRASATRARTAASSGGRSREALDLVTNTPGITIRELATAMSLSSPNYLYRLLPQLERDGKVRKEGRGYHAVPAAPPAPEE